MTEYFVAVENPRNQEGEHMVARFRWLEEALDAAGLLVKAFTLADIPAKVTVYEPLDSGGEPGSVFLEARTCTLEARARLHDLEQERLYAEEHEARLRAEGAARLALEALDFALTFIPDTDSRRHGELSRKARVAREAGMGEQR
jgi:hypothetical protein